MTSLIYCRPDELGFGEQNSIKGHVVRSDTLSDSTIPVANADVYVGFGFNPQALNFSFRTKTDSLGDFKVDYLKSGTYDILVIYKKPMPGYDIIYSAEASIEANDESNDNGPEEILITSSENVDAITGRVFTPQGLRNELLPQKNVAVYIAYNKTPTTTQYVYKLTTDENGAFTSPNTNLSNSSLYQFLAIYTPAVGNELRQVVAYRDFESNGKVIYLNGNGKYKTISGTVVVADPVTGIKNPRSGVQVYVGYNMEPNSTQFLFSVTTDQNGIFTSPLTDVSDSLKYSFFATYSAAGENTLTRKLTFEQFKAAGKVVELEVDSRFETMAGKVNLENPFTGSNVAAGGAEVFIGKVFTPTPSNFSYKADVSADGSFKFNNIPTADKSLYKYFVRYNYFLGSTPVVFEYIGDNNTVLNEILVRPVELPGLVTLTVFSKNAEDGQDFPTPQPSVDVCLFANREVFRNSTSCAGSVFAGKTDSRGQILIPELISGSKYYIKGILGFGTSEIVLTDSVKITNVYPQAVSAYFK
jgi:hypothetical protein